MSQANLGPRVRAARMAQGISLRELARRINVSPSFVSQLERNKANASVGTLYALVEALDLSIDQLMSGDPTEPTKPRPAPIRPPISTPVQRAQDRPRIQFPGVVWDRLTHDADPQVDFLQVEYSPGSASCAPEDMMRHGGHEYGYVLSGLLHVQIGFDSHELAPGDTVTFDSMTPHRLSNPGQQTCTAIWVVVGRSQDPRAVGLHTPASATHLPSLNS